MKKDEKRNDQRIVHRKLSGVDPRPKQATETTATSKRVPKQSRARALDKLD